LRDGGDLPEQFTRREVAELLRAHYGSYNGQASRRLMGMARRGTGMTLRQRAPSAVRARLGSRRAPGRAP
jgi:hypothetical protein